VIDIAVTVTTDALVAARVEVRDLSNSVGQMTIQDLDDLADIEVLVTEPESEIGVIEIDAPESFAIEASGGTTTITLEALHIVQGPQGEQGEQGPQGPQGEQGPQGAPGESGTELTEDRVAGGSISALKLVYVGSDGFAYAASSSASATANVVGIAKNAVSLAQTVSLHLYGSISDASFGFTPGASLFLSANGTITETPPATGYVVKIGYALSSTSLFFDPDLKIQK
jgi:hypothetical protein